MTLLDTGFGPTKDDLLTLRISIVEELGNLELFQLEVSVHLVDFLLFIQKLLVDVGIVDGGGEWKNSRLLFDFLPVHITKPRRVLYLLEIRYA